MNRLRGHDQPMSASTSLYGSSWKGQHSLYQGRRLSRVVHEIFVWTELHFVRSLAFFAPIWSIILLLPEIMKRRQKRIKLNKNDKNTHENRKKTSKKYDAFITYQWASIISLFLRKQKNKKKSIPPSQLLTVWLKPLISR